MPAWNGPLVVFAPGSVCELPMGMVILFLAPSLHIDEGPSQPIFHVSLVCSGMFACCFHNFFVPLKYATRPEVQVQAF